MGADAARAGELDRRLAEEAEATHRWIEGLREQAPLISDIAATITESWFELSEQLQDQLIRIADRFSVDTAEIGMRRLENAVPAMTGESIKACLADLRNYRAAVERFKRAMDAAMAAENHRSRLLDQAVETEPQFQEALRSGSEDFAKTVATGLSEGELQRRFALNT